jgi:hypothetical protein
MRGSNDVGSMKKAKDSKCDPWVNNREGKEDKGGGPRRVRGGWGKKNGGEKERGEKMDDVRAGENVGVRKDGRGTERA